MAEASPLPATSATAISRLPSGCSDDIEIVAAHLVAGVGAEGDRVAGNLGQLLRQQRALNLARRVQILLHARELDVALVVARVFKRHGGLQRQAFKEVGLGERKLARARGRHDELGHFAAVAVGKRITEQLIWARGVCCGIRRQSAVGKAGSGKRRAGHLQLAHHDAQDGLEDFFLADRRVHLARGLKQRLQPEHLLLQLDCFAARGKLVDPWAWRSRTSGCTTRSRPGTK